jgi:PAS domain S-box-containing protein
VSNIKVNLLLVDDQPSGMLALEVVLRSPQYNLVKAASGREALKCLQENDFALILLDVQMPGLDGFETAERIKANESTRDIPIIFITGVSEDNLYIQKGYRTGAVDYICKPYDADILRSKVTVFIELFKKNQTIKRQSELIHQNEIAKLADAIPHIVWEAKGDGTITYLNKSWCDYTGLTLQDHSDAWKITVHPDDLRQFLESWHLGRESKKRFEVECRFRRGSDGAYRWHLVLMIPETSTEGQVTAWLGTGTDIHDRKQVEEQMRRASEAAQEAAQVKSDFLATMSHEIRTPLNAIIGMTGLLLDTNQTPDQKDFTETVRQSSATLLSLINDILDFSKIESGKLELEAVDFDLGQIVRDCERAFLNVVQKKGIRLETKIKDGIPLNCRGDSARLQQILTNLINNAIKFTSEGKVTLQVEMVGSGRYRFEVSDTGIGIPANAMNRLFERFSQADSSTTRRFGGTGLGLSICKGLVGRMGGKINVTSEEGRGSTFWFELPFEKGATLPAHEHVEAAAIQQGHRERIGRILIAEDNTANQKVALRAVEKFGYRAEVVGDGNEVLDALREIPYDLILMDWQMPEMDGCTATKIIRTSKTIGRTDIPIIAMTANAMKGDQEKCLECGMNDYISKPIDFQLLARKLERWMPATDQDKEIIDQAALDNLRSLDDPTGKRPSLLKEYLEIFFRSAPVRIESLKSAARLGDSKTFHREAHTLKSNGAYVGAFRMVDLCKRLEEIGKGTDLAPSAPLISSLEEEYFKAKVALERESEKMARKQSGAA